MWTLTTGNIDQDEHLDLAVGNIGINSPDFENGSVAVLTGTGDGTFDPLDVHLAGDYVRAVEIGDLDGDGDLDAVAGNSYDARVQVLPNDGTGGFGPGVPWPAREKVEAIALADFDEWSDPDIQLLAA